MVRSRRDGQMVMYELTELGARAGRRVRGTAAGRRMSPLELPMAPGPRRSGGAPRPRTRAASGWRAWTARRARGRSSRRSARWTASTPPRCRSAAATLSVDGDAPDARITGAVRRAGYRARPAQRRAARAGRRRSGAATCAPLSTTAAVVLLLLAVASSLASAPRAVSEPLYLLSMAVGGWPIARAAAGRAAPQDAST